MKINDAGLALIKRSEGLRLEAYPDPGTGGSPWTIGYGCTTNVKPGMIITPGEAERRLHADLARFETGVSAMLTGYPVTSNQFSAMVSLAYNIGLGNFATSSVLKRHKAGKYDAAGDAFLMWVKAAGRTLPGLVKRREAERELYLA